MDKGDGKFASLTETPGTPVTREGADMMFTRYDYARSLADEKRILKIRFSVWRTARRWPR